MRAFFILSPHHPVSPVSPRPRVSASSSSPIPHSPFPTFTQN
ncbi:MAG: hypothetical protein SWY16_18580 [Cyanobacteriota bacterium]|nr:hypothetical protein [Cyanobacteriota bacterium]